MKINIKNGGFIIAMPIMKNINELFCIPHLFPKYVWDHIDTPDRNDLWTESIWKRLNQIKVDTYDQD